ncbi:hypothetical protein HRI_004328100 [Hibiscus trionum]|uniref:Uncharacterized protein n=1 Tax=Hibiscus trionum TaxID=183268 RepID=A0A9W7J492_HIBTR|nr:hypothetical protein HRI_004328100 [Hibiscus trionum]
MFPSTGNGCCSDPMAYFATDPSFPFFDFPSPYYNQCELQALQDYDVFLQQDRDLLFHNQTLVAADSVSADTNVPGSSKNEEYYSGVDCCAKKSHDATEVVQRTLGKRSLTSKRDRHSKINTANGPRDRRMRLSLEVAREFFGLQDMLGYDKASRTVEWLLIQASQEIKRLKRTHVSKTNNSVVVFESAAAKSPSSTSEGEVLSAAEPKKLKQKPKTTLNPVLRDLRDKARARAKERTKAKKMWTQTPWGFNSIERTGEESGNMIDESSEIINKWSPNSMLNCLQNSAINQEHDQLTGFLSFCKPWETYDNSNH